MRYSTSSAAIASVLLLSLAAGAVRAEPRPFSLYGLAGWEEKTYWGKRRTQYEAVAQGRAQVIEARCDKSASSYIWRERVNLQETPILAWRWKVEQPYAGINERSREGDDFSARVYVVRGGFSIMGADTVAYVWSSGSSEAEDWVSPHDENVHVVALRRGAADAGQWKSEARDLREDFKKFFHDEIEEIAGVAIMSDCDDHQGRGRAWFADINYKPAPPEAPAPAKPMVTPDQPAMTPAMREQEPRRQPAVELPIPVQGAPGYEPPAGSGPQPVQTLPQESSTTYPAPQ